MCVCVNRYDKISAQICMYTYIYMMYVNMHEGMHSVMCVHVLFVLHFFACCDRVLLLLSLVSKSKHLLPMFSS